jgi:hypothetical protein
LHGPPNGREVVVPLHPVGDQNRLWSFSVFVPADVALLVHDTRTVTRYGLVLVLLFVTYVRQLYVAGRVIEEHPDSTEPGHVPLFGTSGTTFGDEACVAMTVSPEQSTNR